ncbi:MAG TPA: ATP synthase F1 subunit gamma [Ignavibacteriales bacterium]|nr:ATP synthase F1 subunit gamma [Ignavibacteriales bacterium]
MATLRDIRRRITGVTNTQKITKAMKMVAAARLRRAQEAVFSARPYAQKVVELTDNLVAAGLKDNPLFRQREVKNVAILVITGDKGLAGSFNVNVIRQVTELINNEYSSIAKTGGVHLFNIGKKGQDFIVRKDYDIAASYPGIFNNLKYEVSEKIMAELIAGFLSGKYDKVVAVYNQFKSVVQQNLTVETLLPIIPVVKEEAQGHREVDFIFEPDKEQLLGKLLPKRLNSQLWRMLLESGAAELGARMTAMETATENAKELINALQVTYNKKRQSSITTEIIEIVSGANALHAS